MKIAVVGVKGIPARQGGIEHYCQELYRDVTMHGHSVDLYARSEYTQADSFSCYMCNGVKVISLPSLPQKGLDALFNSFIATVFATVKKYDIIHFHALGPSLFCWLPRSLSPAKIVVTCHGLDWQRSKWSKFASSIIYSGERMAVANADKLIVVSQYLQSYFRNKYSIESSYIPTAPAAYSDSDDDLGYISSLGLQTKKYMIFLGRLVPEKRPELLLEAFKIIDPQDWKLVFVGDTSGTDDFKSELIASKNDKIIFTNTLTGSLLAETVRNAGLFVLPSDLEGLPLVVLEAMREEIPVVASDIPPHKQLIGEDRGMLFKAGNLDSLVATLRQILARPADLATKTKKAKKYIQDNYSWQKVSYENLVLYAKLSKLLVNKNLTAASRNNIENAKSLYQSKSESPENNK